MKLFGSNILVTSTLSGRTSNRALKKLKENHPELTEEQFKELPEVENIKALDPTKIQICMGFYGHWLNTAYKKLVKPEKFNYFELYGEFDFYVSKKIASLKNSKSGKATKKNIRKSEYNFLNELETLLLLLFFKLF